MREEDGVGDSDPRFDDEYYDDESVGDRTSPSLTDDILALFDDGQTYVEAEVAYQKTRASFALEKGRKGALFGVVAFALFHLALVALVVGAVIALSPILTPIGATLLVTAILVLAGILFARMAMRRFSAISTAFSEDGR